MPELETLLLECPSCSILIDVNIEDCKEGREFQCPICGEMVCFEIPEEQLERTIKEIIRRQQAELKRAFRLSFGDV